ncbi:MAG: type II toxin-antitoxin system RelE/ParE family toxin [Bacteroidota bacterium]|nr:type II toxin-antitoxin system RelE/ParE family toxin [Bacteroidota bacterium]
MNFEFEKAFVKDFRKLKNKELASSILEVIKQVSEALSPNEIINLKKLSGYKSAFRIRIGDYRIGVIIEKNTVTFVTFAHRKEIYNRFP